MLKSKWYLICIFLIIYQSAALALDMNLNLIKLKYRDAYEVKSLLKPMLVPGAKISGSDYTLIISTTSKNMSQLKSIVKAIDIKPVMLKIIIKNSNNNISSNYVMNHYTTISDNNSMQSITVLDGRGAFISDGKEQVVMSIIGGAFWPAVLNSYKKVQTGFYIVPYLRGRQVMLKIIYRSENSRNPQNIIELQSMATTIMVPLAKWTSIGDGKKNQNESNRYQTHSSTRLSSNILIKINKLR